MTPAETPVVTPAETTAEAPAVVALSSDYRKYVSITDSMSFVLILPSISS